MSGYTKLFSSILASTVWSETNETRIVWITLLAMADKNGVAEGSVPGLAVFARLPVEAVRTALERLSGPDPDSRSQEHEGRRIEATDGGWVILNHAKYRAKLGVDERREYNRLKQRQHRAKRQEASLTVNHGKRSNHKAEAEADANTEEQEEHVRADAHDPGFDAFWVSYPKKAGKKDALKAWTKLKPSTELVDRMLDALDVQCKGRQFRDGYIPLPATWLRGERWNDELDPTRDFYRARL